MNRQQKQRADGRRAWSIPNRHRFRSSQLLNTNVLLVTVLRPLVVDKFGLKKRMDLGSGGCGRQVRWILSSVGDGQGRFERGDSGV